MQGCATPLNADPLGGYAVDGLRRIDEIMTPERARWARTSRVSEGYFCRNLAQACADAWGTDGGSNQYAGTEICVAAARALGDEYPTGWDD